MTATNECQQDSDCLESKEIPRKGENLDEEVTSRGHLDEAAAPNPGFNLTRWSGVWLQSAKTRLVAWKREQVTLKQLDLFNRAVVVVKGSASPISTMTWV